MKTLLKNCWLAAVALVTGACSDSGPSPVNDFERVDIELSSAEKEIALSQYDFPVKLLSATVASGNKGNVMVSPISASMVLGMLANAIDTDDRNEILAMINSGNDIAPFDAYLQKLNTTLPDIDRNSVFSMSNGFWLIDNANLSSDYNALLTGTYSSEIKRFDKFSLSTMDEINSWVNEKTNGGIQKILSENDVKEQLKSVWLNALYFKGNWRQEFNKDRTSSKNFYPNYPNTLENVKVDMMYGSNFRYNHFLLPGDSRDYDDAISTVMLPYGNESFIFSAVLPSINDPSIENTLEKLDTDYWKKIDEICSNKIDKPGSVAVRLPRMHNEMTISLIPAFRHLGLDNIFDSGMGVSMKDNLGLDQQYVSVFKQSVVLDVDEEGSEIKVVTVADGMVSSPAPPPIIEFNRPFIYFIRERTTGAVLLAGVYRQP